MMKNLLHEIHRRSLWQVLGLYLAGSWVALQVVEQLTNAAGLPDWVQPFALVLLIVGLPIVLGTAFVQVRGPGSHEPPGEPSVGPEAPATAESTAGANDGVGRILTWRNAVLGGAAAMVVLGLSVGGYFVMRATGVGPAASLVARGVIEEGDPILLAEFENSSGDPSLGGIVTEALRVDLSNGTALRVLSANEVGGALARMGRAADEPLTAALAYEVAVRDGIKAVVEGEIGSAGSGYILVARIGAAGGGAPLATFRRTASNADEIIPAIDGLSQDIREKAGESLRSIRGERPLEAVTTSSLEALKKYAAAEEAEELGDHIGSKAYYEEAVELDPEFAMAWRKLSVSVSDAGGTREEASAAATRAFELRDRLTDRERYLATAYYHRQVTGDAAEQVRAYRSVLDRHPDDGTALNNLSILLGDSRRYEEANDLLRRAISGPGTTSSAFTNLVVFQALSGDVDGARATQELVSNRDVWYAFGRFLIEMVAGDLDRAHEVGGDLETLPEAPEDWRHFGRMMPGVADVARGRPGEAVEHFEAAGRVARELGRGQDAVESELWAARGERWSDDESGRARVRLRRLLAGDAVEAVPVTERDPAQLAMELVRAGLVEDAREVLDGWSESGGLASGRRGRSVDDVREEVNALRFLAEDPGAAVAALRALRTRKDCPRCFASDIARALEDTGDPRGAIEEYERAWSASEGDARWFGVRRVLIHERLGRLYDEIGNLPLAIDHYSSFVAAWADAEPEMQTRVRAAQARIDAIDDSED